jgi:hypothetical protein
MKGIFKPVSTLSVLARTAKQFVLFWALVLTPVAAALMYIVYERLPLLGIVALYGLAGIIVAAVRSTKTKVEVTDDLKINTTKHAKVHPELLKTTIIINVLFTLQAFGMYFMFSR